MKYRSLLLLIGVLALLFPAMALAQAPPTTSPAHRPLRLVIVGDSTVSNYPQTSANRGWGQYIQERFKEGTVQVINLAVPGRSTKTFIREGRWKKALDDKPDYVLIQFGHNDSHDKRYPEATTASGDYKDYLRRYIDDSRAAGATPILVTPMVRRTFDAQGKIAEPTGAGNLLPYVNAMKEVGRENKAPVIDLYASSKALAEELGPTKSAALANRKGDNTHFNEKGARAMADLVMKELPDAAPGLKPFLKTSSRAEP